jgi:hypothetical protein
MLSRRHRTAAAAPPITRCEHPLLAAAGASTSLFAKSGSTPRTLASRRTPISHFSGIPAMRKPAK